MKKYTFLKKRKLLERLDVLPFIILQSLCIIIYSNQNINSLLRGVIFVFVLLMQGIAFFSKFWSEDLMAKICYKVEKSIEKATHCRIDVISEKFKMNNRTSISHLKNNENIISMEFEKILLVYDKEKSTFIRPKLNFKNKKLIDFLSPEPIKEENVNNLLAKFGENRMKIPIPSFFTLYKEHIVAPFFVFQLFCILLWVFDDYGIHSMITLFMLCIFEATVVSQRIFNLATLRNMRVPLYLIFVYRNNYFKIVFSFSFLIGDIVCIIVVN